MVDWLGLSIDILLDAFKLDAKRPFGIQFWLSLLIYSLAILVLGVTIFIAVCLTPLLITKLFWLGLLLELLLISGSVLLSRQIYQWSCSLIQHIRNA